MQPPFCLEPPRWVTLGSRNSAQDHPPLMLRDTAAPPPPRMDDDSIAFMALQPPPPANPPAPERAREASRRLRLLSQPDLPHVAEVREFSATGPGGVIPLRLYRGASTLSSETLPLLVYYHGGGWVVGDLDSHDWTCRMIAN